MKLRLIAVVMFAVLLVSCSEEGTIKEKKTLENQKDKASYIIGLDMGRNLKTQAIDSSLLDMEAFTTGLKHGLSGKDTLIKKDDEIKKVMTKFQEDLFAKQDAKRKIDGLNNKKEGEKFLTENAKKPGVKITASGLQYKVIESGSGKMPKATDKVRVHYTARLVDGTIFDSSIQRGQPAEFPVNGVIKGWGEVMQLMKEGDKFEVYIPSELAYGEQGAGQVVGPNSVIIFEISLIAIVK